MNENLNLTEILKECPKGIKLYSPIFGDVYLDKIRPYLAVIVTTNKEQDGFKEEFLYDGRYGISGECMLFPSKDQRDWSKWQRPFVKGDVLVSEAGNIVLFSHIDENQVVHYLCLLRSHGTLRISNDVGVGHSYECALANDFQKQRLFDALKKEGYEWDAEKKELKTLQPFKDGDIIYNSIQKRICICHYRNDETLCISHCRYNVYHKEFELLDKDLVIIKQDYRIATDEEKQILFDAIKENGYKWYSKTKTLEKLIEPKFKVGDKIIHKSTGTYCTLGEYAEGISAYHTNIGLSLTPKDLEQWELMPNKFDPKTLHPFDKVLVRDDNTLIWVNAFFGFYDTVTNKKYPFIASAVNWAQCIPYEGNEHLLGTYEDCDEYYKNW